MNIRNKGHNGEREICKIFNSIYESVCIDAGIENVTKEPFQRNQMQTAIGGSDISNPFRLSIEVKRQEQLNINTWWNQVIKAAEKEQGIPVLIYRQNRKKWNVVINCILPHVSELDSVYIEEPVRSRCQITFEDFEQWLYYYLLNKLLQ